PLLHLHGAAGSRLHAQPFEEAAKAARVRVIAPDRCRIGQSDPRPDVTLVSYSQDLEGLADALGIKRFALSGHSNGGVFAMAAAHALGGRVTGVIPINPTTPVYLREARRAVTLGGRMGYRLLAA